MFFPQKFGLIKVKKSNSAIRIGTPERKILIALTYYVILVTFSLTSFTIETRNEEKFFQQLFSYFSCEVGGHNPEMPCNRNQFRQITNPQIAAVSNALLSLFPAINLVYALDIMSLRSRIKMCCKKRKMDTQNSMHTATDL